VSVEQLHVHRSNRAERLVDALFEEVRKPLRSPFQKELIVVQGQGMATWLNMQLSRRAGVWANTDYLYPKHFIERIFEAVLGAATDSKNTDAKNKVVQYSPESLSWTIAARLTTHLDDPAFEALRDYVGVPVDEERLFSLSGKIADTFDEYLTFRPELIRLWGKGEALFAEPQLDLFQQSPSTDPAIWQRRLWRDIETVLGPQHSAGLEKRYHGNLARRKQVQGLPERLSVFGLSTLPPMYIRALAALSKLVPVHVYTQSPTQEYFGDVLVDRGRREGPNDGNRLVRSLGTLAAEFNQVLTASCEALGVAEVEHTHYEAPPGESLLQHVQRDMLQFTESVNPTSRADGSIAVHSCHSPIREVEVLHDQILHFVHGEGYRPEDILVLLPDVEAYAPLLDAVFRRDDDRFLPYRIADRQADAESAVVKAFLRILDLVSERVTSAQVMDILSLPPVRKHFGLDSVDLPTITEWLVQSHITWGIDDAHRTKEVGDTAGNTTWQAGLDRLLLGYAVDTAGEQLVAGIYPYEHIEGKNAVLLGNFRRFASVLFKHVGALSEARLPLDWQVGLAALLEDLLSISQEDYWQKQWILDALASLSTLAQQAGYHTPVGVQVVRRLLYQRLEKQGAARGFLAGGITMSALIPMRSVPFEVVCVMGMNDGAFPRDAHRTDFNLLEHGEDKRRYGDPNRRLDDRYLFLEALASARSKFVVTYVGQSVRDNSVRSPSVVLLELLEAVRSCAPNSNSLDGLLVRHPLQPFSPRYFNGSNVRLHSYAQEFVPKVDDSLAAELGFLKGALAPPEPADVLPLSELSFFFRAPTRYLLERRLKVRFQEQLVTLEEHDATALDPLEAYQVGAPLLDQLRRGVPVDVAMGLARAQGALPAGQLGSYEFHQLEYTALSLAEIAGTLIGSGLPAQISVSVACASQLVEGTISDVFANQRVHIQFARVTGRVVLRTWLEHLILAMQLPKFRSSAVTWLVGREGQGDKPIVLRYGPVAEPEPLLADLLSVFEHGCRSPVPLFPDLAYEFTGSKDQQLSNTLIRGWEDLLDRDATVARVFGRDARLRLDEPMLQTRDPDYPTFGALSRRVFGPLLNHLENLGARVDDEAV
jgi:exodeoxyribonuclease V gamma subunit